MAILNKSKDRAGWQFGTNYLPNTLAANIYLMKKS